MPEPHPSAPRLLRAVRVSRSFDGIQALDGVDLELAAGELVGLIGPNGAGKSTLVNLLSGVDVPTAGSIVLDGARIDGWSAARRARAGLARTFQHGRTFRELSVRENVEVAALGVGAGARAARRRADALLGAFDLTALQALPAGALSHGHERRLCVARALAGRPAFVLMDEPGAGMGDADIEALAGVIREAREAYGVGVLLIDHHVPLVLGVCDRVVVLDRGRVLAAGTPDAVRNDPVVADTYLGVAA